MAEWEDDLFRRQREAAEEAYERAKSSAQSIYNTGAGVVNNAADTAILNQNKASDGGLQQAYIGKMQDQRNLGQKLASLGLNGGASETSLLEMENRYRKDRAGIENERSRANNETELQRQRDLAGLLQALQQSLSSAYDNYSNRLAGYEADAANRYAQQQAAEAAARAAASRTPVQNNNWEPAATEERPKSVSGIKNMLNNWVRNGATTNEIRRMMQEMGYSSNLINNYINNYVVA